MDTVWRVFQPRLEPLRNPSRDHTSVERCGDSGCADCGARIIVGHHLALPLAAGNVLETLAHLGAAAHCGCADLFPSPVFDFAHRATDHFRRGPQFAGHCLLVHHHLPLLSTNAACLVNLDQSLGGRYSHATGWGALLPPQRGTKSVLRDPRGGVNLDRMALWTRGMRASHRGMLSSRDDIHLHRDSGRDDWRNVCGVWGVCGEAHAERHH